MKISLQSGLPMHRYLDGLRNPFGLDSPTLAKSFMLACGICLLATLLGVATVAIANGFDDKPIFLLALPLVVLLGFALVLSPQGLLVAIVLLRAITNPLFSETRLPGVGGLGGVLNLVVIVLALVLAVRNRAAMPPIAKWLWVPFLGVAFFCVLMAPDRVQAIRTFATWVTSAAVFYSAFHCVKNARELDTMLKWMLLSSIPVLVYSVITYLTGNLAFQLSGADGETGRLSGTLGHPNILAFYAVVMVAAWLLKERSRPGAPVLSVRSIGWVAYMVLLLAVLAGTQTRGAWAGALFLFLMYGLFVKRVYLLFMGVAMVSLLAVPGVVDRLSDLTSNNEVYTYSKLNSFAWRQYIWSSGISWMSPLSYVFGNGVDSFKFYSIDFFPLAGGRNWGAHSVFVQLFFDMGAIGILCFAYLFLGVLNFLGKSNNISKMIKISIMTLAVSYLLGCVSDNMLDYLVVNWNLWFLLGLVAALAAHPVNKKSIQLA